MSPLPLHAALLDALFAEARACYPKEACGVVVGPRSAPEAWRFVRFDNLQDRYHQLDPEAYPRDARTAYFLHPLKLQRLVEAERAEGRALIAVVHSHPDHPSYFSATDRRAAAPPPSGTPTFPLAAQLVVSVFAGEVAEVKGFAWESGDWAERALAGLPELPGPPAGAHEYAGEV